MTKPMTSVLADALRLDDDARAELAAELLASLDGPTDPDAFFEPRDSTADKAGKVGFSLLMVAATIGSAVAPFFLF